MCSSWYNNWIKESFNTNLYLKNYVFQIIAYISTAVFKCAIPVVLDTILSDYK